MPESTCKGKGVDAGAYEIRRSVTVVFDNVSRVGGWGVLGRFAIEDGSSRKIYRQLGFLRAGKEWSSRNL
jgi:hypothetical protein